MLCCTEPQHQPSVNCKECKTTQLVWLCQQVFAVMPSCCFVSSTGCQYVNASCTRRRWPRRMLSWQVFQPTWKKNILSATRQSRSAARLLLTVPRTNTEFATRSFSCTAPVTWNNLPADVLCVTANLALKTFKDTCFYAAWLTPLSSNSEVSE